MMISVAAYLDELDVSTEMVDHRLIPRRIPPFDRDVVFAPGGDNPKRDRFSRQFVDLRVPPSFLGCHVDVAPENRCLYSQTQFPVQEFNKAVNGVVGRLITKID